MPPWASSQVGGVPCPPEVLSGARSKGPPPCPELFSTHLVRALRALISPKALDPASPGVLTPHPWPRSSAGAQLKGFSPCLSCVGNTGSPCLTTSDPTLTRRPTSRLDLGPASATMNLPGTLNSWLNPATISRLVLLTLFRYWRAGSWLVTLRPCNSPRLPARLSLGSSPALAAPRHSCYFNLSLLFLETPSSPSQRSIYKVCSNLLSLSSV